MERVEAKFKREFVCESLEPDPEMELSVRAWMAYHEAADLIDAHYPSGQAPGYITRAAVLSGFEAMKQVAPGYWEHIKRNTKAKLEALRRLEQQGRISIATRSRLSKLAKEDVKGKN